MAYTLANLQDDIRDYTEEIAVYYLTQFLTQ